MAIVVDNNTTGSLAEALCLAQEELKNPSRDSQAYGYKYADLAGIIDSVKPVLKKYGLSVIQFPVSHPDNNSIGVRTVIMHSSGESLQDVLYLPLPDMGKMSAPQAAGASITYARRYALSAVLNIAADDDTDAADVKKKVPNNEQSLSGNDITYKLNTSKAELLTPQQRTSIFAIINGKNLNEDAVKAKVFKVTSMNEVTKEQASKFIDKFGVKKV